MLNESNIDTNLSLLVKALAQASAKASDQAAEVTKINDWHELKILAVATEEEASIAKNTAEADLSEVQKKAAMAAAAEVQARLEADNAFNEINFNKETNRLSVLVAELKSFLVILREALRSSDNSEHGKVSVYTDFYKKLLAVLKVELWEKIGVLRTEAKTLNCVYQAITIQSENALQLKYDTINNMISHKHGSTNGIKQDLLIVGADYLNCQPVANLITLADELTALLSASVTNCEATAGACGAEDSAYSIVGLYGDMCAELNYQLWLSLTTVLEDYQAYRKLYDSIPEHGYLLQDQATDLKNLIIKNEAGDLTSLTEETTVEFISQLGIKAALKLMADLKILLGTNTDTSSLAAAKEAITKELQRLEEKAIAAAIEAIVEPGNLAISLQAITEALKPENRKLEHSDPAIYLRFCNELKAVEFTTTAALQDDLLEKLKILQDKRVQLDKIYLTNQEQFYDLKREYDRIDDLICLIKNQIGSTNNIEQNLIDVSHLKNRPSDDLIAVAGNLPEIIDSITDLYSNVRIELNNKIMAKLNTINNDQFIGALGDEQAIILIQDLDRVLDVAKEAASLPVTENDREAVARAEAGKISGNVLLFAHNFNNAQSISSTTPTEVATPEVEIPLNQMDKVASIVLK